MAGVGLGIVTLLVAAGMDTGETFIGIPLRGWIFALLVASVGLAGQLVLSGKVALRRERRLVYAAAEMRELSGRRERLATTDALTGLFNRRIFFEQLGIEFRRSIRYRHPMSVIMADLDRFKDVNDRHGHPFGDLVLSVTAQTLRASVRECARVGYRRALRGRRVRADAARDGPRRGNGRRREAPFRH